MAKEVRPESPESLKSIIERTADARADFTRSYLESKGKSLNHFAETLKKDPFNIEANPKDNKSLAFGVYELQKKLGLPEKDFYKGCDGKFGPYTDMQLEKFLLRQTVGKPRVKNEENEEKKPSKEQKAPPAENPLEKPEKETLLSNVSASQVGCVGDSLVVGIKRHMPDAVRLCEGGQQTAWMRKKFNEFLKERAEGKHREIKRVIILGGVNDIVSAKSIESIQKNFATMYKAGRAAGLTVIACTIPEWDTEAFLRRVKPLWLRKGWGEYPLSSKQLQERTRQLNQWILAQNVDGKVDLYTEMHDRNKYTRSKDGLHLTDKGYKAMAKYIEDQANISEVPA